ncbi:MobC family plasmid mobilization relaxosome protein [Mesorhizobium sp. J428]|uniref:MobC family plasmid mobilization relaxosome protein n=1 Tax=Mesorhizobium sp. J428 TaxID=2898440 RepID=UPI002151EE1F|nr:MobC family plasmid mobilization relaxosome protein [Mesorhizobium sp. J428]MCR5860131.1 MobC family plasmid mobilization relaxosome protein [Mesorhizobium sp. J428]MCR5860161.1 MobC family plasmid mobilization relaxosome protein [Mesorhizobium sp. J428]MCR5860195.1 MobC family plasmid mobilization relaxosome protein [Mesorhizobium sp. J428]MCR5860224.1 MobC family plasmid mobilization relaxosome protein [Mesorhizobium sp. J428]
MTTEKPNSPYLNLYLGELKEPWEAYCAARNLKPGAAIRAAIQAQLKAARPPYDSQPLAASQAPAQAEPRRRYEITLIPSEMDAIRRRLDGKRTPRDWIAAVIRAALTREPQFGDAEVQVLANSNYQLQAIGRNLNQIARRLNERKAQDFPARRVADIERTIAQHTEAVTALMRACQERWPLA